MWNCPAGAAVQPPVGSCTLMPSAITTGRQLEVIVTRTGSALDELGATQTRPMNEGEWRWCHILHGNGGVRSYRSHRVTLENTEYVSRLSAAAKIFSWVEVGDNEKKDGPRTRMKLDVPGGSPSPSYWQAPTRTAAPVRPSGAAAAVPHGLSGGGSKKEGS
jgi:hypothetical protein